MDYDTLIKETKKSLESYSSINTQLEELYRQAKQKNAASYDLAKKDLDEQYNTDRNSAVTKGMLDEKDLHQFLAARGLSSSGESVQAKIDSAISVNNTLNELAKQNTRSLSSLEQERLNAESKLDTELAEKKTELDKWQTELATKVAELKQKSADSKTVPVSNDKTDPTDTEEKSYTPAISAKELAKNILSSYSTSGKINTALQKSYISIYLNQLVNTEGADSAYIKELLVNLKAAGYTEVDVSTAEAVISVSKGKAYYKEVYEKLFEFYHKGNNSMAQAKKLAENKARKMMLDYIYERCSTIKAFETACRQLGVTGNELNEYNARIENIIKSGKGSLVLGSKLSY
ncbi:MAG: hypothetical protein CVU97_07475 [Firmicutes bacterium HGW-Firmicutes-21]|nr:MAG: hypothetical protein CVU97_07475 [Firmicutes bacterium HGW-Firmicutes-21]